jgi:LPXTG-motif cell wall-anchored protein
MSSARRFAAAFAVVGAGVLAYAVPASGTGDGVDYSCLKPDSYAAVAGNLAVVAIDVEAASATVQAKHPFCEPVKVVLSTYVVPETWQPSDGWSEAAAPQDVYDSDVAVIEGKEPVSLHAEVTDCGAMQTDLYWWVPKGIVEKVTYPEGHAGVFLAGGLWARLDEQGKVIQCKPESPTPSPTTTPAAPTTSTPTTPAPTTPAPTTSAPKPTPSPTEGLGAPIVVPMQTPPPPPVLAETGSDSTVPIVGLGILLLGAGIGLSVVGRRRTA